MEAEKKDKRKRQRRWKELSTGEKMRAILMVAAQITLLVAALSDIRRRPADQIKGKKWVWALLSFVNFIGPISYFVFGRKKG